MKNRGTWILFGAVVLLSAYAYFGEYKGKEKAKASKELKSVILKDIKQDQISSTEILPFNIGAFDRNGQRLFFSELF